MGGTRFFDEGYGASAKAVFDELRDDALYDHGHSGYSGTIAEKPGFTMVPFEPQRLIDYKIEENYEKDQIPALADVTPEEYAEFLDNVGCLIADDKWGNAACLEMTSDREGLRKFCFFGWASS